MNSGTRMPGGGVDEELEADGVVSKVSQPKGQLEDVSKRLRQNQWIFVEFLSPDPEQRMLIFAKQEELNRSGIRFMGMNYPGDSLCRWALDAGLRLAPTQRQSADY